MASPHESKIMLVAVLFISHQLLTPQH